MRGGGYGERGQHYYIQYHRDLVDMVLIVVEDMEGDLDIKSLCNFLES